MSVYLIIFIYKLPNFIKIKTPGIYSIRLCGSKWTAIVMLKSVGKDFWKIEVWYFVAIYIKHEFMMRIWNLKHKYAAFTPLRLVIIISIMCVCDVYNFHIKQKSQRLRTCQQTWADIFISILTEIEFLSCKCSENKQWTHMERNVLCINSQTWIRYSYRFYV